jgi:hypothetical protein
MKTMLLIAGAAAVGLTAGASQAATHHVRHHHRVASAGAYAEPKQPIAYNQLSAYLKASPRERASNDWSGGQMAATTGANVNTSATTAAPPAADTTQGSTTQPPSPEAAPAPTPPTPAPDVNAQPPASGAATPPAQPPSQ